MLWKSLISDPPREVKSTPRSEIDPKPSTTRRPPGLAKSLVLKYEPAGSGSVSCQASRYSSWVLRFWVSWELNTTMLSGSSASLSSAPGTRSAETSK
jgi:hypothetical protein